MERALRWLSDRVNDPEEKKMILGAGSVLAEMDAGLELSQERLNMRKGGTPNIHS